MTELSVTRTAVLIALVGSNILPNAQMPRSPGAIAFEVASVKPNKTSGRIELNVSQSGRVFASRHSVGRLIQFAYGIKNKNQLAGTGVGGGSTSAGWVWSETYDIRAVMPHDSTKEDVPLMMQALLSERFQLRMHTETRSLPVLALVLARQDGKLGPDLKRSKHDCAAFRATGKMAFDAAAPRDEAGKIQCTRTVRLLSPAVVATIGGSPISELAKHLEMWSDRPVLDQTGLTGNFDIRIAFSQPSLSSSIGSLHTEPDPVPLMKQAVQEQLGLRLEARTASTNVLVIDSIERPLPD